jgi:hypothetical protein
VTKHEPVNLIRADLIEKQDKLIAILYDETSASGEIKQLKDEIDRQKDRLNHHNPVKHQLGK